MKGWRLITNIREPIRTTHYTANMVLILMGVSGCGKTLTGQMLSNELNLPFYDADDFHPKKNVEKMKSGQPLTDEDRRPWLETLAEKIKDWEKEGGAILACSALKESYRNILSSTTETVQFVYLKGSQSLIARRLTNRFGHFMPESLLDSQFNALEEPDDAITVSIENSPGLIVRDILKKLSKAKKG